MIWGWNSCCVETRAVVFISFDHDDVIKWKHFPRHWPFVRGIHRPPVNSPHKDQWRGALMFSLICVWINGWVNNREAGDSRRYRVHYDVIVMPFISRVYSWKVSSLKQILTYIVEFSLDFNYSACRSDNVIQNGQQVLVKSLGNLSVKADVLRKKVWDVLLSANMSRLFRPNLYGIHITVTP